MSLTLAHLQKLALMIGLSVWLAACSPAAAPETTATAAPNPLAGGVLATFDVNGEVFKVWVTNTGTIQQLLDLKAGTSAASIPNGKLVAGAGQGDYNLPWHWHLDPQDIEMAELTTEVCDGAPSYVEEHLDEFISTAVRYCPWAAKLKEVQDFR